MLFFAPHSFVLDGLFLIIYIIAYILPASTFYVLSLCYFLFESKFFFSY